MSLFPRIQSPCPYKGKLSDIMEGDTCRLCHREVHDITDLSSAARQALVAGCSDEICVSYKLPVKSALAAMALGASMATPAYAQVDEVLAVDAEPASGDYCLEDMQIIVGGLRKPGEVEWLTADLETDLPDMPVVYDDEPTSPAKAATDTDDGPKDAGEQPLIRDRPVAS